MACLSPVHGVFIVGSWHVYHLFMACLSLVHGMFIAGSWRVYRWFMACLSLVHGCQACVAMGLSIVRWPGAYYSNGA